MSILARQRRLAILLPGQEKKELLTKIFCCDIVGCDIEKKWEELLMASKLERIIKWCRTMLAKLYSSLRRFPETLLMCAATVTVLIILNHGQSIWGVQHGEYLARLAAVLALGVPLSLCIKVFFERVKSLRIVFKVLIYAAAAAGLVLYYIFLLPELNMVSGSRYVAISLALYLAFTFIPYFYRRQNYELYVIRLFISFLVTYLFAAILFGGLSAILGTINFLFSADIPYQVFFDIWLIVAGIFAPAFFLADIPAADEEVETESYPQVISVLLSYIVVPLILAYSAILYAYLVRILVTRQWPEVMVSHLVLWYALISTLVLFCVYPLRQGNRWIKAFTSFFPILILPLLGLMFTAMGVRIAVYGVTENRYFVLAAGLWVAGSMLYLVLSKKPRNVFLPASLALVAILSVCGPWSSYSVSVLSQNRHFERIAAEYNLIQDGKIVKPAAPLPEDVQKEISSIILYFDRHHGLEQLRALPHGFKADQMEELFGFPLYPTPDYPGGGSYFHHALDEAEACLDISGYDYFMQFSPTGQRFNAGEYEVAYDPKKHELAILRQEETVYSQNVSEIARNLHRNNFGQGRELYPKDEMSYLDGAEDLELLYVFIQFGGWENMDAGEINIEYMTFYLFVKMGSEEN